MSDIALSAVTRNALLTVQDTVAQREIIQRHLESGKAVNDAIDNAVRYYKAKGLSDSAEDFIAVKEGMDQAISLLKVTSVGLTSIESVFKQMKGLIESAKAASATEIQNIAGQWDLLLDQTKTIAFDASYQGRSLLQPPDRNLQSNTSPMEIQVSPDANQPTIQVKSAVLPPYNAGPWVCPGANVTFYASTKPNPLGAHPPTVPSNVSIDQNGINTSTTPFLADVAPVGLGGTPQIYYNPGTGQLLNEDPGQVGGAATSLTNVQLIQSGGQDETHANPLTGWDNPAWILQATFTGDAIIPAGTYKIALQEMGSHGSGGGPYQAPYSIQQTPSLPLDTINEQDTTINYSAEFNGFRNSHAIAHAEASCNNSISYIHSLQSYYGGRVTFLQTKMDFNLKQSITLNEGADKLQLADLNEESARFVVLQTREQIGQNAIKMAGDAQANIMTLLK